MRPDLRQLAEKAAGWWDGFTWQPEPGILARADSTVATFEQPEAADLYEHLDPPAVIALLDRVAALEAELARLKSRITDLVDAGWMSQEAATELRNVYDGDEEGQR